MKIFVRVKPNAKVEKVEEIFLTPLAPPEAGHLPSNEGRKSNPLKRYNIWVKSPAKEGKANEQVIKLLAKHFGVAKSKVKIISGLKSRQKVIAVAEE